MLQTSITKGIDGEGVCSVNVSCRPFLLQNEPQTGCLPNIYSTLKSAKKKQTNLFSAAASETKIFCMQFCKFSAVLAIFLNVRHLLSWIYVVAADDAETYFINGIYLGLI